MKYKKITVAVFLAGLLMIGIGGGIAFAEFSALSYGGDIDLSGELKQVTLQQALPENTKSIRFYVRGYDSGRIRVIADSAMAKGQISIDVICDQEVVVPYIQDEQEFYGGISENTGENGDTAFMLGYSYRHSNRDTSNFFKVKDDLLKGLKERKIYSYSREDVKEVVIKAPPELVDSITVER